MNRWILLEHEISKVDFYEKHYDFLIEMDQDCLTWKFFKIPLPNKESVEIFPQENHRLIWLTRNKKMLSNGRGVVTKKDSGTYKNVCKELNTQTFSLILNGKLLSGKFNKTENFCWLTSDY